MHPGRAVALSRRRSEAFRAQAPAHQRIPCQSARPPRSRRILRFIPRPSPAVEWARPIPGLWAAVTGITPMDIPGIPRTRGLPAQATPYPVPSRPHLPAVAAVVVARRLALVAAAVPVHTRQLLSQIRQLQRGRSQAAAPFSFVARRLLAALSLQCNTARKQPMLGVDCLRVDSTLRRTARSG